MTAIITDGSRKQLADGCFFSSWRHLDKRFLFDERILLLFDEFL